MKRKILMLALSLFLISGFVGISCQGAPTSTSNPGNVTSNIQAQIGNASSASGVIEITAQELITQLVQNPNRYSRGTTMRVSGTVRKILMPDGLPPTCVYKLGPETQELFVLCEIDQTEAPEAYQEFQHVWIIEAPTSAIVQGTFVCLTEHWGGGVWLSDCFIISYE